MNPKNISFSLVFSARDPLFKLSLPPLFFQKEKAPYLSNKTAKKTKKRKAPISRHRSLFLKIHNLWSLSFNMVFTWCFFFVCHVHSLKSLPCLHYLAKEGPRFLHYFRGSWLKKLCVGCFLCMSVQMDMKLAELTGLPVVLTWAWKRAGNWGLAAW